MKFKKGYWYSSFIGQYFKFWIFNDIVYDKKIGYKPKRIDFSVDYEENSILNFSDLVCKYNLFGPDLIIINGDYEEFAHISKEELHKILHERKFKNRINKLIE